MKSGQYQQITVALAGNPNVGKSTLFNGLTGLRQHTGNWPGKTVGVATGYARQAKTAFQLIDLPGTYTLSGGGEDERIAAAFIASNKADCTVVVCDGCCLERSLILALQILMLTDNVVVCVNLIDEAQRRGIRVDAHRLEEHLGATVVLTNAGKKEGLDNLLEAVEKQVAIGTRPIRNFGDPVMDAERIAKECTDIEKRTSNCKEEKLERLLVSRRFGIPVMFGFLFVIIWLTVWGANYPSQLLGALLDRGYTAFIWLLTPLPSWLRGILADGMYATAARVISVMLPPMAIFFPLFTILEDVGYLPRMAFLLDGKMRCCGGCGKQALTMCMGLGCNAVGVTGCRIMESPRQRLLGILTNAMIPCNGRFPTLIALAGLYFSGAAAALCVAGCVVLGILGAMAATGTLSKTVYRHKESIFLMEMPPFRKPRIGQILIRSLLDRTLHISLRALKVAAPAGAVLWMIANTNLMGWAVGVLDPVGFLLGMNGAILLAFVFSFPANELFIPVVLMALSGAQTLQGVAGMGEEALRACFTWQTAVCAMVFVVFHWPCATTLMTVYKETGSKKETAVAFFLPTAVGILLCMMLSFVL